MEQLKEKLLENNKQTYWVPDFVKVDFFVVANMMAFFSLFVIVLLYFCFMGKSGKS